LDNRRLSGIFSVSSGSKSIHGFICWHKLSNAGVSKNDTPNLYWLNDNNHFEKVPVNEYSCENNEITIELNRGEEGYYSCHALTVTNCDPSDNLGQPLPGDLVYRLSSPGGNNNWLPGHVGIYVGEKYGDHDKNPSTPCKAYNVIEAVGYFISFQPLDVGGEVEANYYESLTDFNLDGQASYMGARQIPATLFHTTRNEIVKFAEDQIGKEYAFFTTVVFFAGLANGDRVKGPKFNCVGLAEAAYESVGLDIVSDLDEGNQFDSLGPDLPNPNAILSPQEQLYRTVPASGIIGQNTPPIISTNLEVIPEGPVETNSSVSITCTASDQDGDLLTYIWDKNGGTFEGNPLELPIIKGKTISWGTPNEEGRYEISCKVIDNYGGEDEKSVTILVGEIPGQISGSVKDAVTQSLLPDVSVKVYDGNSLISSGTTESNSLYSISVTAGSGYRVEFTKFGYIPAIYYDVSVEADVTTYLETVLQIDDNYSGNGNISGKIFNALTGEGVSGLTINLREGINVTSGTVITSATTESGGYYSIANLNVGYYTAEVSGTGYNTTYFTVICVGGIATANQNATISPVMSSGETRIVLTWGVTPSDLDSHLTGPTPDDSRFHIFYWQKTYAYSGLTYADLDRDDVTSYGPETTTIYHQLPGVYRFSVHDYTNRSSSYSTALSNSGAQVRVYRGDNLIATFNVPAIQEGTLWTIFEIEGDTIIPINSMSYESSPSSVRSTTVTDVELMKNLPPKR